MIPAVHDERTIASWRAHSQRLVGGPYGTVEATVAGLLAVQAENHSQASWAVATRTARATDADFRRAYDAGAILRTHVLRPTWHFVTPDDIRWLLELTAPRVLPVIARNFRELGWQDPAVDRGLEVIVAALSDGRFLTRKELGQRLVGAGLPPPGRGLGILLARAELEALICSGPLRDGDHTYALLADRAPLGRRRDRDDAVLELVVRYFTGHGPATDRDLAYWASMTLTDIRAGLAEAGDQLDSFDHDGRTFWHAGGPPTASSHEPRAHLLQILDEYSRGYQDSRYLLDVDGIVPAVRAAAMGMTLVDTQMVGDMRRTLDDQEVTFEVGLFRPLRDDELQAVREAADRYGRFLQRDATVVTRPVP